ncbi:MAG: PA domain-containing protein, partial [Bacteroidota bacterium]
MSSRSIVFTLLGMLLLSACQRTDLDLPVPEFTVGQALSTTATFDSLQMDQWLQQVCSWPHRRVGSTNWQSAMSEIETIFQQLGYTELQKDFFDIQYWECTNRSLSIQLDGESYAMPAFFDAYCGFTPPEGLTAELVYVGQQVEDDENLTGKIAVVDMTFSSNSATGLPNPVVRPNHLSFPENSALSGGDAYWQAKQAGALGVIFILADFHENISDYLYIPHEDMIRSLPALFVGNRDGIKLRCFAQEGRTANLMVEGIFETRQVYNLWTSLPGQSTENLIISTHGDAPFRGVIEDGSGLVSVFSQAQAWMAEPLENRPKTLHFVITAGHLYKDSPGGVVFSSLHPSIINETA